ncbi:MAG: hypothetical protein LH606_15510, partial [Cytophagaceae bacterium]|nr:hypothetical protein [Cytophagaceae bacterium]
AVGRSRGLPFTKRQSFQFRINILNNVGALKARPTIGNPGFSIHFTAKGILAFLGLGGQFLLLAGRKQEQGKNT